jgi:RNA-directed DNA polymerase
VQTGSVEHMHEVHDDRDLHLGWMDYYGRYYRTALYPLLRRINIYLRRWAGKKYRRLRTYKRFKRWWTGLLERAPGLLAH